MNTTRKSPAELAPQARAPKRARWRFALLFVLALLALAGFAWTESARHVDRQLAQAIALAGDDAAHDASDIALGLHRNLSMLRGIPATFSASQQVADALQASATRHGAAPATASAASAAQPAPSTLSRFLQRSVADLNAVSALWVIDRQGYCIAASNAGTAESFVGTNYAEREYFKVALQGFPGQQFATGKQTGIAGMYFSAPVLHKGQVLGMVVAKVDLPFLSLWLSQANAFVTDAYGVIILATDPHLLLHSFADSGQHAPSQEQAHERYRLAEVPALPRQKLALPGLPELLLLDRAPTPLLHTARAVSDDRLLVHVLAPVPALLTRESDQLKRFALETGFGLLLLLLASTALFYVRSIQRARAALQVHKARLDEAQVLAQVGSWELDFATGAMRWSDQVHRIFGLQAAAGGASLAAFLAHIQEADRPVLQEILQDRSAARGRVACAAGIVRADGQVGSVRLQLQPVMDKSGDVQACLGTMRDTTEQDLLEQELRRAKLEAESANRLKSDFLANMSHELKTPLNTILGMSHLAAQGELSAQQRAHIQTAHRSAEHLLQMVNEILDYSSLEAGRYTVLLREFALRELTRKLTAAMEHLAEEKGLEFQLDLPADLPARLRGDPAQLERVLHALVSNAIKFTQEGRVSVGVEISARTASTLELHFWVNDTGMGISTEQQSHLFQAFSQADSSRSRKFGGTGLGLAISQKLIDRMGGRLWVQSALGTGSTFHFTVPFEMVSEGQLLAPLAPLHPLDAAATQAAAPGVAAQQAPLQVLLVEDNPVNQELALRVLKKFHMSATLANHGQEALDILASRADFHAILMDCHMPVMDGYTAARKIRQSAVFNAIPIIALTANVSAQDRKKITESGMCDVVAKPYRAQELIDTLLRWARPASSPQGGAEPSSESPAEAAHNLPPLAGIDVDYGLGIAMSDAHLYRKLLRLFAQSEADFAGRFKHAWQAGDSEHSARLAHSLKGVAASIGAKEVQAAALALERACHHSLAEASIAPLLADTLQTLQQVLEGLAVLNEPEAAGSLVVLDLTAVRSLLARLASLLAQQDLSAYDLAEELATVTAGSPVAPLVKKLTRAIDRFDLDAAQAALQAVSAALEGM